MGTKGAFQLYENPVPFFKTIETKNIYNYNITQWFYLLTLVRHDIVHNGQKAQ